MTSAPPIDSLDALRLELLAEGLIRRETRAVALERVGRTPGLMTPLYTSAADETFHVRAGEITFFVAPAGVPRALRVESPVARWLVMTDVP